MTAIQSEDNKRQNEALAHFAASLNKTETTVTELALAYKTCIDCGCDMSKHEKSHGRGFGMRLLKIAEGRLVAKPMAVLAAALDTTIDRVATLSKDEQEAIFADGLTIVRNGKVEHVPIYDVSASEVRRAIDPRDGRGRIVPPAEQKVRAVPTPSIKKDQKIEVWLTHEERVALGVLVSKQRKSLQSVLRSLVRDACDLD